MRPSSISPWVKGRAGSTSRTCCIGNVRISPFSSSLTIPIREPLVDPRTHFPPQAGFLRKERITETNYLVDALEAVLADRSDDVRDDRDPAKPMGALSQHQLEVLRLMAQGYTNEVIARRCEVSPKTVERWVGEIFKALGVSKQGDINPRVEVIRQFVAVAGLPGRRG